MKSGSPNVAEIAFQVQAAGSTPLKLSANATNPDSDAITLEVVSGGVDIGG